MLKEHVALRKTEKELDQARQKVAPVEKPGDYDAYPEIPLRGLGHRSQPLEVRRLLRGELSTPGETITANLPARLAPPVTDVPREKWRTALANWVASDRNPLTAPVIVNRV